MGRNAVEKSRRHCQSGDEGPIIPQLEMRITHLPNSIESTIGPVMTESSHESASLPESSFGDDLPPVQPPSAGFIVQLFVFPALIVMAVVAIWWMFGMIAAGEQDWHTLLRDLQSQNLHVRNRAMYGLAQILEQDSRRGDQGQHLCDNREIAQALSEQLIIELRKNSSSKEGVAIQEFLTRALGRMTPFDVTAPALHMALEPQREIDIRKVAVFSISLAAGQASQQGQPLTAPQTVEALVELSGDALPVLRQSAAFALGLFESPDATHQLQVLLENGDELTRVNAAIGLARHGSTDGFAVIRESLKLPDEVPVSKQEVNPNAGTTTSDDRFLVVKNLLKAVGDLASKFDTEQRRELITRIEQLSEKYPEIRIRVDAKIALNTLKGAGN